MIVATVLKSGGHYTPEWVQKLKRQVAEYCDWRFVCLSDVEVPGVETWGLSEGWPGWWSKMELFTPGLFDDSVLYLDLDTLVVGDLTVFGDYDGDLALLSDLLAPANANTGVMLFRDSPVTERIWNAFTSGGTPQEGMNFCGVRGDGEFLRDLLGSSTDRIQTLYPDTVVSFKKPYLTEHPDCVLVCGHGNPKFDDPAAMWSHTYWSKW